MSNSGSPFGAIEEAGLDDVSMEDCIDSTELKFKRPYDDAAFSADRSKFGRFESDFNASLHREPGWISPESIETSDGGITSTCDPDEQELQTVPVADEHDWLASCDRCFGMVGYPPSSPDPLGCCCCGFRFPSFQTYTNTFKLQIDNANLGNKVDQQDDSKEVTLSIAEGSISVLCENTNELIGIIDRATSRKLLLLVKSFHVHLKATISACSLKPSDTTNARKTHRVLQIILHGQMHQAESLGHHLSSEGLFLQHPQVHDTTKAYYNPHYLSSPDHQFDLAASNISTPSLTANSAGQTLDEAQKTRLLQLFNSDQLPEILPDLQLTTKIITELTRYVKLAIKILPSVDVKVRFGRAFSLCYLGLKKSHLPSCMRRRDLLCMVRSFRVCGRLQEAQARPSKAISQPIKIDTIPPNKLLQVYQRYYAPA